MYKVAQPKVETYSEIGKEISEKLDKLGMSRYALAKEIGISCPYLTDIMQGNRPNSLKIPLIFKVLDRKIKELN